MSSLSITVTPKAGDAFVVALVGSLDTNTFERFETQIAPVIAQSNGMMVLDCEGLDYLSSAGIRVLLKARDMLKKKGQTMTFMRLQPQIRKVFDIVKAIPSMQVFSSIAELDAYLDAIQKKVKAGKL